MDAATLKERFPLLNLEDKVLLPGGGDDEKAPCTIRRSPHANDLKAPRRSIRGVKPNPKYLNMVKCDQLLTMLSTEWPNNQDLNWKNN